MRFPRKRGSTSVMVRVFIPDNTATTGAGVTGLTGSSTNIRISYRREIGATVTYATDTNILTIATPGTFSDPGTDKIRFGAVDATAFPGLYEMQFANDATAFGTGDTSQAVYLNVWEATTTALKIGPNAVLIPLVPWDYQDGVTMGLTALPNAAAEASGGLATLSAAQSSGGAVPSNLRQILGTALTETAGLLAAGFKKFFNVATPTGTLNSLPDAVPAASGGLPTTDGAKVLQTVDLTAGQSAQIASDVWDELLTGATHNIPTSAGRRLRQLGVAPVAYDDTITGTPTATTVELESSASAVTDFYYPGLIALTGSYGTQYARIAGYNGTTKIVTVATAFAVTPSAGDDAQIIPWASVRVSEMDTNVLDADAIKADAVTKIQAGLPDASTNAVALLTTAVDGLTTVEESLRLANSANGGKLSGAATSTVVIQDLADTKPRITASVDGAGNRTAVTTDLT
jgi:hypothetical protein